MPWTMRIALLIVAAALSACEFQTGPPTSGLGSSSPNAVSSAAGGIAGGGNNVFTRDQVTAGTPAASSFGE